MKVAWEEGLLQAGCAGLSVSISLSIGISLLLASNSFVHKEHIYITWIFMHMLRLYSDSEYSLSLKIVSILLLCGVLCSVDKCGMDNANSLAQVKDLFLLNRGC